MGNGGIPGLPLDSDIQPPSNDGPPLVGPPLESDTWEPACPDVPTDMPREHLDLYYRDTYCLLKSQHHGALTCRIGAGLVYATAGAMLLAKDLILPIIKVFVPPFARLAISIIGDLRKTMDVQFAQLAMVVLGELLGAELQPTDLPMGGDFSDHVARAERVGAVLHTMLVSEFVGKTELTPEDGVKAAERFSGLVINFGTATGVIAFLGGLIPIARVDEIREIGEEVAKNLGLGRLHRMAMKPLFTTLLATPYQWYLNLKFRPTQFTAGELVNPFTGVSMNATVVHDSMARLGYSDDKIRALIELHQKKLPFADLFRLHKRGALSDDRYKQLTKEQGIPDDSTGLWELGALWTEETKWEQEVLTAAADAYRFGNIDRTELEQVAKTFLHDDQQIILFMMAQDYKRKVPHESLSVAQITKLYDKGIFDFTEMEDHLKGRGFSDADTNALELMILLDLNKQEEAAKAKAKAAAAKAAAAAAKSAASGTPPTSTP